MELVSVTAVDSDITSWSHSDFIKVNINSHVPVREDTHKKGVFLVVGPLRFYPPYTNGLVVHATFFSSFF